MLKKCSRCREEKLYSEEYFYRVTAKRLQTICKQCQIQASCKSQRSRKEKEGVTPYYVYEWYFEDTGKPFYIGKGRGRRYREKKDRSKVFVNYLNKYKCASRKIIENLTEKQAYDKEVDAIKRYKDMGIRLINKTVGGDAPPKLKGILSKNRRSVVQLSLDGELINKWFVIRDAEEALGISNTAIVRCCKDVGNKSAGGFLWVYAEDYDEFRKYTYKRGTVAKPVLQYGINGDFIREWECAKQASNELGIGRGTICSCLKGKYSTCGGYQWRYKEGYTPSYIPPINTNEHYMQIAINRIKNKMAIGERV